MSGSPRAVPQNSWQIASRLQHKTRQICISTAKSYDSIDIPEIYCGTSGTSGTDFKRCTPLNKRTLEHHGLAVARLAKITEFPNLFTNKNLCKGDSRVFLSGQNQIAVKLSISLGYRNSVIRRCHSSSSVPRINKK
jgi:hypothetical protein